MSGRLGRVVGWGGVLVVLGTAAALWSQPAAARKAQPKAVDASVESVLTADRAFAARSAEAGSQSAFLDYLADDGVLMRPTAVRGREWLEAHEAASGRLDWQPEGAAVSCDGSLAVSIGPWTYSQLGNVTHGHYLTVWRRDPSGRWRVLIDHGVDTAAVMPGARSAVSAALAQSWPANRRCNRRDGAAALARVENEANSALAAKGWTAGMRGLTGTGTLVLRDGHEPDLAGTAWPNDEQLLGGKVGLMTRAVVTEATGDLGLSYGEVVDAAAVSTAGAALATPRAVYLRIWTRRDAKWLLAVDMMTPVPTEAAP